MTETPALDPPLPAAGAPRTPEGELLASISGPPSVPEETVAAQEAAGTMEAPLDEPSHAATPPMFTVVDSPTAEVKCNWAPSAPKPKDATDPHSEPPTPRHRETIEGAPYRPSARLSPQMTAVFGAVFGLIVVGSLIALFIQLVPTPSKVTEAQVTGEPSPSASVQAKPVFVPVKPVRVAVEGPWRLAELAHDPTVVTVQGTIERRSFIAALDDKGVQKAQIYRILKAFESIRKFDKCAKKDRFAVAIQRASHRVIAFEYEVSPTEIYQAREDKDGLLAGAKLDMKIAEGEVVASFYVGKDRVASAKSGGLEDGALEVIDEAFHGRLSSEAFEEGATVRLIAIEQTALGLFASYKKIIAIEYRPPDPAAKPVRSYAFDGKESHGYFDERGKQPYANGWRSPIPGAPVTSRFNPKRMHPVLKKIMPHQGTDFGAAMGTPVFSAYRGVVQWIGMQGPSGNLVTVEHPNGVVTGYAHLSRYVSTLKVGDRVGTHQLVGYVGSTGRSTGPHLHFSAKKDGKFFDAETLQLDSERVIPAIDRQAFLEAKAALDARLDSLPLPEPPPEPSKAAETATAPEVATAPSASASGDTSPPASAEVAPEHTPRPDAPPDDSGDNEEPIVGPALGDTGKPGQK